jgi:hypothetical protein
MEGTAASIDTTIISHSQSARAICRFLEEKHGIKVSYVTVGRALRDPQKYWNLYFDSIERRAWNVAEAHDKTLRDFISEPEKYQEMLEGKPVFQFDGKPDPEDLFAAADSYKYSVKVLDEKWFCFNGDILEEARFHLLKRFVRKPAPENDGEDDDQD